MKDTLSIHVIARSKKLKSGVTSINKIDLVIDVIDFKWFKSILKENNLENKYFSIIGGLFAYSPNGNDGFMPCEAIRDIIEEYHSDELRNAYQIDEFNKRGLYSSSAGNQERDLAKKYEKNAQALQEAYPHTAQIYFNLSNSYKKESRTERKLAEDVF